MLRRLDTAFDRPLVLALTVAMAWLPGWGRASCGCAACDCPPTRDEACCGHQSMAVARDAALAELSCCIRDCVPAEPCHCEVHRTDAPAAPQWGCRADDQPGAAPPEWLGRCGPPPPNYSDCGWSGELLRSGPPLRILYCVWRN